LKTDLLPSLIGLPGLVIVIAMIEARAFLAGH
jgi:hypothetical protein